MAERYAVATGNWSDTATWDGGTTLPGVSDDVYANGFTVTVNQDVTVLSIRTTAGTTAVAGGGFVSSTGTRIITANIIAGTTICLTATTATTNLTVNGNVTAGNINSAYGVSVGSQTLTVNGNVTGGSANGARGINAGSGSITVVGNVTGGSDGGGYGIFISSTGTVSITGTATGGSVAGSAALRTSTGGTATIIGNVVAMQGLAVLNEATLTITGDVTGGSISGAYGVSNSQSATVTINGNVSAGTIAGVFNNSTGKILINGTATANGTSAVINNSSGIISISGDMIASSTGYAAVGGKTLIEYDESHYEILYADSGGGTPGAARTFYTVENGAVCGGSAYVSLIRTQSASGGIVASGIATEIHAGHISNALIKCGTITSPASTGNQTYTVSNFGGTPKLLILWGSVSSSEGIVTELRYSIGAATSSSNRSAVCVTSRNNLDTSDSRRYQANDKVFVQPSVSSNTVILDADLVSLGTSGDDGQFTLNWTTNTLGAGFIINYMLVGGDDVEANIMEITSYSGTGTQTYAHGLSGIPTTLINYNIGWGTIPPSFSTHLQFAMGFWDGNSSRCIHTFSENVKSTSNTWRIIDDKFIRCGTDLSVSKDIAEVSSVDGTNVALSWTHEGGGAAGSRYNWVIALRGIKSQVSTFNVSTTNGSQLVSGLNFKPNSIMYLSALSASSTAIQDGLKLMLGVDDGTNSVVSGILDEDNQDFSNTDRFQDSNYSIQAYDYNQTKLLDAKATGFGPDKAIFDVDWYDTPESYEISYLSMGDIVYPLYRDYPSGGTSCGGTAYVSHVMAGTSSGGTLTSASAWVRRKYELIGGEGGLIAAGEAFNEKYTLVGGLTTGGSAFAMSPAPYRNTSWSRRLPFMKHLAPIWPYQVNKDSYQYQGLVAWWPASSGSSKLIDVSGRGYHGTHYGGTTHSITEKGIAAISYDGVDSYTNCGQTTIWNLDEYTITGWFKTSIKTHRQGIVNKKLSDLDVNWDIFLWGPEVGQTNGTLVFAATNGQVPSFQIAGTADYADGEWHSFAAVVDTNARLYVDGELVAETTASLGVDTALTEVMLGADRSYDVDNFEYRTDRQFNGLLEDVRIYNNSLSEIAILQICDPIKRYELYEKTSLVGIFHSTEGDFGPFGGTKVGGEATVWARYYSDVPSGGTVISGAHPVLVHGGSQASGSARVAATYIERGSGGTLGGAYTGPMAYGGVRSGGSAYVAVSHIIGGGTKVAGNITSQATYYDYPNGGIQVDGSGIDRFEFLTIISEAGVTLGGTNTPDVLLVPPASGGLSLSGIAETSIIHNPTADDTGVVISGFGSEVHAPTILGGLVGSGTASELKIYGGPPLTKDFISFVYSGGTGNADPDLSLGGDSASFPVSDIENNLFDDVLGTDVSFGSTDYRAFYVFNDHPEYTLYNAKVWIEIVDTVADISIGVGTVNAIATSIGFENNAPSGVSFSQPFAESEAIEVGDLAPLDGFYVWVKRTVAPNALETNGDGFVLHLQGSG